MYMKIKASMTRQFGPVIRCRALAFRRVVNDQSFGLRPRRGGLFGARRAKIFDRKNADFSRGVGAKNEPVSHL